jgi:DNA processing protein
MNFSGNSLREPFSIPHYTPQEQNDNALEFNDNPPEDTQKTILDQLSFIPISVDELIRNCHVSVSVVQGALLEFELAGRIKRLPRGWVNLLEDV